MTPACQNHSRRVKSQVTRVTTEGDISLNVHDLGQTLPIGNARYCLWVRHNGRVPPSPPVRPAKSADVAARAGVSRTTVSHILNGRGDRFPEATRDRVLAAAADLEYRPSPAARNLARGRSDTIVLLVPNAIWGPNLQNAADQVAADARPLGAGNVVVRFASGDSASSAEALLGMKPLAVVDLGFLSPADRSRLAVAGIATVPTVPESASAVSGLGVGIADLQVETLVASGARRIWYAGLADRRLDAFSPERFDSLSQACAVRDLPAPQVLRVPMNIDGARQALSTIPVDIKAGLACYNDDVGIAVLAGARAAGIAVPEQAAVIGMDHTDLGQLWTPRLTTIEFDMRGYMDAVVEELKALLSSTSPSDTLYRRRLISLVQGESS